MHPPLIPFINPDVVAGFGEGLEEFGRRWDFWVGCFVEGRRYEEVIRVFITFIESVRSTSFGRFCVFFIIIIIICVFAVFFLLEISSFFTATTTFIQKK